MSNKLTNKWMKLSLQIIDLFVSVIFELMGYDQVNTADYAKTLFYFE